MKDIYLPKDNIPKIAEVREIENEIPSYEEFLKNYQTDQEVSESYENEFNSYGDIGISRRFGPCYVCQKPEQWTVLKIRCGGENCSDATVRNLPHVWCGGNIEVSNRAYAKCSNCLTPNHLSKWSGFNCSNHQGYYRSVSESNYNSFRRSLILTLATEDCSEVMVDLLAYMISHKGEWDS